MVFRNVTRRLTAPVVDSEEFCPASVSSLVQYVHLSSYEPNKYANTVYHVEMSCSGGRL